MGRLFSRGAETTILPSDLNFIENSGIHGVMMRLMKSVSCSIAALLMLPALAQGESSGQLNLNAQVAAQCGISNLSSSSTPAGSELRVYTACNTTSFTLEFSGVENIQLSSVGAVQNINDSVSLSSQSVRLNTARPGGQIVDLRFDNSPAELSGLIVSIGTF